jgi:hypothetical protein
MPSRSKPYHLSQEHLQNIRRACHETIYYMKRHEKHSSLLMHGKGPLQPSISFMDKTSSFPQKNILHEKGIIHSSLLMPRSIKLERLPLEPFLPRLILAHKTHSLH